VTSNALMAALDELLRLPPPDRGPAFRNGVPTGRPLQRFRGIDGKVHVAPAGSGPLNPVVIETDPGWAPEPRMRRLRGARQYGPGRPI